MKHLLLSLAVLATVARGPETPGDAASDTTDTRLVHVDFVSW